MTNKFEYVASGLGYIKPFNKPLLGNPELLNYLKENIIKKVSTDDDYFSMLFNAYVEPSFGRNIDKFYKDSIYHTHSDSGGLQVITRGSKITPEIKQQVYSIQGQYSDIGMSFDEIPILTPEEGSGIGKTGNRLFDSSNLDFYINESIKNFKIQSEYFKDHNTTCKPMLIIHGNCYDTFMYWYKRCMDEIKNRDDIGGISISAASHGNGFNEEVERAFVMREISKEFNKFHLLGVGSIKRLIPYLYFLRGSDNIHLSYDSTSHTMGTGMGRFYSQSKTYNLTRNYNHQYDHLWKIINDDLIKLDISKLEFFNILNSDSSYFYRDNDKKKDVDSSKHFDYYKVIFAFFFISVQNFMRDVRRISDSSDQLSKMSDNCGISKEVRYLKTIRDFGDLNEYLSIHNKTSKIKNNSSNENDTLENFFG